MPAQRATNGSSTPTPPSNRRTDWQAFAGGLFLAAAAAAAYSNTFAVPFVYDDGPSIADNPTLRHLGSAFLPPFNLTVGGRPVLNATLALNFHFGGINVGGYHAVNLAILVLSGLALYGILRRTPVPRLGPGATRAAFCAALLWVLHPLLTESVTYVIQRAESLMGLFYLLTLYCFIRGAGAPQARAAPWYVLSVCSCLLGMGTKEVMVSAPLIVLLYDRTFVAGGFRDALGRRRWFYAGLGATWLALALLVLSTHGRGATAGFGSGISWWSYLLAQLPAIVHYLRLCFWPSPLVFDYGSALWTQSSAVAPSAVVVVALLAATVWALVKRPALGFLGAAFFAILAPSSSIVPIATEPVAEHRMYLPLIPVVAMAAVALQRWLGRAALPLCLVVVAGLFAATWRRNEVYSSAERLWSDTAAKAPGNERAHNNLGFEIGKAPGRLDEAIAQYDEAIRLRPDYADARNNLGCALEKAPGRQQDAVAQFDQVLRLEPDNFEARNNLGNALCSLGRTNEAMAQYEEALRLKPDYSEAHYDLANALNSLGRAPEAAAEYGEALRLRPDDALAHNNLGNALVALGKAPEAMEQYEEALRLDPRFVEAHFNLGNALVSAGRPSDAIGQYGEALRLRPDYADAHYNLGNALNLLGRASEAIAEYREVVRIRPDSADAHYNLGNLLDSAGRPEEAIAQFAEAVRLRPDFAEAHNNLGCDLQREPGHLDEAIAQYGEALRINPGHVEAHYNLGSALQGKRGRIHDAITQYKEALRLRPSYPEACYNLGNAYYSLGRKPEAIAQYEEALRIRPSYVGAHCNLGIVLESLGRTAEAIGHFEEALRLSPMDATVHLDLAIALLRTPGRVDEAAAHLREALRLQPNNEKARLLQAKIEADRH
jgi:tetratricopeptide (TPR) repeat protein